MKLGIIFLVATACASAAPPPPTPTHTRDASPLLVREAAPEAAPATTPAYNDARPRLTRPGIDGASVTGYTCATEVLATDGAAYDIECSCHNDPQGTSPTVCSAGAAWICSARETLTGSICACFYGPDNAANSTALGWVKVLTCP